MPNQLPRIPGPSRSVYRSSPRFRLPFTRRSRSSLGGLSFGDGRGRHGGSSHARRRTVHTGRRWPKRVLIGFISLVVVLALLVVGGYLYVDSKLQGIRRIAVPALTPEQAGKPIDILLVGSDSRSFVNNPGEARAFGSAATQTGQRSDVTIVMRLEPSTGKVVMLSIPRDTWVPIPGTGSSNRINSAFNQGPNQLVEAIQQDFKIPINHVMVVNFPGFAGMVDALGGISLDFPMPVRDAFSGLDITKTGCQVVNGQQALALVRSRHLYYYEHHAWHYDGMSDWSRIRRQQAFFHALLGGLRNAVPDVFTLNSFLDATVADLAVDTTLRSSELISLGITYRSLSSGNLVSDVLPTTPAVMAGQDVLVPAQPYATAMLDRFTSSGTTASTSHGTTHPPSTTRTSTTAAPPTSTAPAGVVTDTPKTLPEPWNPTPC